MLPCPNKLLHRTPQAVTIFAEQKYVPTCYAGEQGDRPDALRAPGLSSRSQVNFIGYQARADSRAAYQPAEAEFLPHENAPHFPLVGICLAPRH